MASEPNRYMLRSRTPKKMLNTVRKLRLEEAPLLKYSGKIIYKTSFVDFAEISEKLLQQAGSSEEKEKPMVLGFDLEWYFSFKSGAGKAAVMQISSTEDTCYVFQISTIKELPKSLTQLLTHENVRLTGNCVKNDVRKLHRDFGGFSVEKAVENCVDLGALASTVTPSSGRWSLEKLVFKFFEKRINKGKAVRMSKWHIVPLSKEQQLYAAIDAYISLKLYNHLQTLQESNKENAPNEENMMEI